MLYKVLQVINFILFFGAGSYLWSLIKEKGLIDWIIIMGLFATCMAFNRVQGYITKSDEVLEEIFKMNKEFLDKLDQKKKKS